MAHIVSFKVKGLAGREGSISKKLNRDVNVFYGLNGSGKTSLLKILHSAMYDDETLLNNVPFESAEVVICSIEFDQELTRIIDNKDSIQQRSFKNNVDELDSFSEDDSFVSERKSIQWKTITKLPPKATGRFRHKFLPTWRIYTSYTNFPSELFNEMRKDPQLETYWDKLFARTLDIIWSRYSNQKLGQVQKIQAEGLTNILKRIFRQPSKKGPPSKNIIETDINNVYNRVAAFLRRQNSENILGSKEEFKKRYGNDYRIMSIIRDINEIEKRIESVLSSKSSLENLINRMFLKNKEINFQDNRIDVVSKKGYSIGLASLSSGEKHLLRLFLETLLAEESSLMIDEPEISLHIDWQRLLISAMKELNPNTQLILATHSPEIMADIPDHQIFNLWAD